MFALQAKLFLINMMIGTQILTTTMSSLCVVCDKEVRPRQHALECESCLRWQHRLCDTGITIHQYRALNREEIQITFHCFNCSASQQPIPDRDPLADDIEAILQPARKRRRSLPKLSSPPPSPILSSTQIECDDEPQLPVPPPRQLPVPPLRQLPVPPPRQLSVPPPRQLPVPPTRQLPVPPTRQLPVPPPRQLPVPPPRQPPVPPPRQPPVPPPRQLPVPPPRQPPVPPSRQPPVPPPRQLPVPPPRQPPVPPPHRQPPVSPLRSPLRHAQLPDSPTNLSFDISLDVQPINPVDESDIANETHDDTLIDDTPTTYEIVEGGTKQRGRKLVSSDGFSYTIKKTTNHATYWTCSVRSKTLWCKATVTQRDGHYQPGPHTHVHPSDPGLLKKTKIYATVLDSASTDPYRPAGNIVDQEMRQQLTPTDFNLPKPANLIRAANRLRQKQRPAESCDLFFEIDHSFLGDDDFFRGDLHVDSARHIIFASTQQLRILNLARRWYVDGTFKVVNQPFTQLFSIHAFVQSGSCVKQVPLVFVLMSRRQRKDYDAVFQHIRSLLPNPRVQSFTMDFEAATWRSVADIFPDAEIHGCAFHWGQAVMRKVANLGLRGTYNKRKTTHHYIRSVLSLPYLPADHIVPAFDNLRTKASTQPLQDLMTYLHNTWLHSSVWTVHQWSVFRQPVRTNNDTEGWHRRFVGRTGATNLHFYRLVPELMKEATTVGITIQLVEEQQLTRYQRETYRVRHDQLNDLWDQYEAKQTRTSSFLQAVGRLLSDSD